MIGATWIFYGILFGGFWALVRLLLDLREDKMTLSRLLVECFGILFGAFIAFEGQVAVNAIASYISPNPAPVIVKIPSETDKHTADSLQHVLDSLKNLPKGKAILYKPDVNIYTLPNVPAERLVRIGMTDSFNFNGFYSNIGNTSAKGMKAVPVAVMFRPDNVSYLNISLVNQTMNLDEKILPGSSVAVNFIFYLPKVSDMDTIYLFIKCSYVDSLGVPYGPHVKRYEFDLTSYKSGLDYCNENDAKKVEARILKSRYANLWKDSAFK